MEIKPLDLILFKADPKTALGVSMIAVGQFVGHAGCVYKDLGGNTVKIIEAVQELSFNDYLATNPNICIRRFKEPIYDTLALRCIEDYYSNRVYEKATKYPYLELASAGINVVLKLITFGLWKKHNLVSEKSNICSAVYGEILNKYFDKDIIHEVNTVSPQDLYESDLFVTIKDFK